jgi:hypothetical protein
MAGMQYGLRWLFGATTACAIGTYALIFATPFWAEAIFTFTLASLFAAVIFAVVATGRARYFWLSTSLFGFGYLVVLHSPLFDLDAGSADNWRINPEGGPPLLTSRLLTFVYASVLPQVHPPPPNVSALTATGQIPPTVQRDAFGYGIRTSTYPTDVEFMRVGHSLFTLLIAIGGGALGSFAYWRYRERKKL